MKFVIENGLLIYTLLLTGLVLLFFILSLFDIKKEKNGRNNEKVHYGKRKEKTGY